MPLSRDSSGSDESYADSLRRHCSTPPVPVLDQVRLL
jgi:hypothetical protein